MLCSQQCSFDNTMFSFFPDFVERFFRLGDFDSISGTVQVRMAAPFHLGSKSHFCFTINKKLSQLAPCLAEIRGRRGRELHSGHGMAPELGCCTRPLGLVQTEFFYIVQNWKQGQKARKLTVINQVLDILG